MKRMNIFPPGPEASGAAPLVSANQWGWGWGNVLSALSSGQCVKDVFAFIPRRTLAKVELQVV